MKAIDKKTLIREKLASGRESPFETYRNLTIGQGGLPRFLLYEFLTSFLGPMPGGIGFFLRKKFYPRLFKKVGTGLIIGRNVTIRHPHNIELGDYVTIDDNCLIDGRGAGPAGVVLDDDVIINRNCTILAKNGPIRIGKRSSIGSNSIIVSLDGVELGEAVLTAGFCHITAGSYRFDDLEAAVMDQELYAKAPIRIGAKTWIGTGATVLDGLTVGTGAIIGAGAIVTRDVPDNSIAIGIRARVIKKRG